MTLPVPMIKYLCANSVVSSKCVVVPESPSYVCLRFFTDTGVIGIGGRGALGRGAQTAASVQSISFDRPKARARFTLLKRPYDGCGAGAGPLLRAPVWRAQVSGVGKGMTCRVDYVVADAVLLQIGPPTGLS